MNTVIFFSNKTSGGRNISSKKKKNFYLEKPASYKVFNLYFHPVNYNNILKYIEYIIH